MAQGAIFFRQVREREYLSMGHETYIYMFLSFFAIVLGEVIEREKSFILHSSALTSPVLLQAFHPEVHGSVRRFTGATQERGHFRSANLDVHEGPYAPPVDPASIPSASISAAFDAPAESIAAVTERILNVLDGKRTWEATVAYLKPKILAAAPSWREGWNSSLRDSPGGARRSGQAFPACCLQRRKALLP